MISSRIWLVVEKDLVDLPNVVSKEDERIERAAIVPRAYSEVLVARADLEKNECGNMVGHPNGTKSLTSPPTHGP